MTAAFLSLPRLRNDLIILKFESKTIGVNDIAASAVFNLGIAFLFSAVILLTVAAQPLAPNSGSEQTWGNKKEELSQSHLRWEEIKKQGQGNYSYLTRWSSWVGFGHETTIVVRDNQVVERRFQSFGPTQPNSSPVDSTSWIEKRDFLGSNKQGHPPKTLDQLYAEAKKLMDKPIPPFHRATLRFNERGLLLACFVQDTRIADDAPFTGVSLTSISLPGKVPGDDQESKPKTGSRQKRIQALEKEISKMKDLAQRAKFTPDAHEKFIVKLKDLESELAQIKALNDRVPSYEKWLEEGKQVPPGMIFTGGSPWFDESTGRNRDPQQVYEMIYGKKDVPRPPNPVPPFNASHGKPFPAHWGDPPSRQTRDLRPLPGGYGRGSSTLARWIQENLDRDHKQSLQQEF